MTFPQPLPKEGMASPVNGFIYVHQMNDEKEAQNEGRVDGGI